MQNLVVAVLAMSLVIIVLFAREDRAERGGRSHNDIYTEDHQE